MSMLSPHQFEQPSFPGMWRNGPRSGLGLPIGWSTPRRQ